MTSCWDKSLFISLYNLQVISRTSPHMCQTGVSKCIQQFSASINARMNQFIWLPDSKEELDALSEITERLTGFPAACLSVDGSLIPIQRPTGHRGNCFYSRKGYTAINSMIAVDPCGIVRFASSRFPGSCHDSSIYRQSGVSAIYIIKSTITLCTDFLWAICNYASIAVSNVG